MGYGFSSAVIVTYIGAYIKILTQTARPVDTKRPASLHREDCYNLVDGAGWVQFIQSSDDCQLCLGF